MFKPLHQRSTGLLAMVALHGLLLAAWWWRPAPLRDPFPASAPPSPAVEQAPVLWLLRPGQPPLLPAPPPAPAATGAAAPRKPPAAQAAARPRAEPQAITLPAPAADLPAAPLAQAEAPASSPLAEPADRPAPLNLDLPRQAPGVRAGQRNPALQQDSGLASSVEARIERLLGGHDGPLTEERMADGSTRFRRGKGCVIVRPSRSAGLDPFNQAVSPTPRAVDSC